jgi:hypothetical protein
MAIPSGMPWPRFTSYTSGDKVNRKVEQKNLLELQATLQVDLLFARMLGTMRLPV